MPVFGERPYTSITIKVNQLSAPQKGDDLDDSIEPYLSDLIHLIEIQSTTGAVEAARAIRKKIKYGDTVEEQLRALSILELLVLNSGPKIGPVIARDDKLREVLKGVINGSGRTGSGAGYHKEVQRKARGLARGWRSELQDMEGYKYLASLWKAIPGSSKTHSRNVSENVFESSLDNAPPVTPKTPDLNKKVPPPRPVTASPFSTANKKKNKSKRRKRRGPGGVRYADEEYAIPQINYKVEAPKIRTVIADCHTHTTALCNTLIALPAGLSPLDDKKALSEFGKCRSIRRKVLRYLQYVGAGDESSKSAEVLAMDEEFLGTLIGANEQLVNVFKKFDNACGYTQENPAPDYDEEDSEGYESYYTDESSGEDEEDAGESLITNGLQDVDLNEGSSSAALLGKKSPPPPPKPASLSTAVNNKNLSKIETNTSVSSDPFGDKNQVN